MQEAAQRQLVDIVAFGVGVGAAVRPGTRSRASEDRRERLCHIGLAARPRGTAAVGHTVEFSARFFFRPVVHSSISSRLARRTVRPFRPFVVLIMLVPARAVPVHAVPVHAVASMAIRSAAMPREPYAFTEPRDMPSVSETCASVMSAK